MENPEKNNNTTAAITPLIVRSNSILIGCNSKRIRKGLQVR